MSHELAPYTYGLAITKSDTVNFPVDVNFGWCDAVYVGGAGVVVAVLPNDQLLSFTCVAGQLLPIKIKRVNSTNTTATLMIALYYR